MTEDERAVFHFLEDAERVFALLRRRGWLDRQERRAAWLPITMYLYEQDAQRIELKRHRELRRAA